MVSIMFSHLGSAVEVFGREIELKLTFELLDDLLHVVRVLELEVEHLFRDALRANLQERQNTLESSLALLHAELATLKKLEKLSPQELEALKRLQG